VFKEYTEVSSEDLRSGILELVSKAPTDEVKKAKVSGSKIDSIGTFVEEFCMLRKNMLVSVCIV
jgi:hypothetical protein